MPSNDAAPKVPTPWLQWKWIPVYILLLIPILWISGGLSSILNWRIRQAMAAREFDVAESLIEWTSQLYCSNGETAFWNARLHRKRLDVEAVPAMLQLAFDRGFDKDRIARESVLLQVQTGEIDEVSREIEAMIADPGEDGAEICEAYTNGALINGETSLALTTIQIWKDEFPTDAQPYYALARVLEHQRREKEAREQLEFAVQKCSRHWPSRYALARLLIDANRATEAMTLIEPARVMRHNGAMLYLLARCQRTTGSASEAAALLRQVLDTGTDEISLAFRCVGEAGDSTVVKLELASVEAGEQNYDTAVALLDEVLTDDPQNLDARYLRGTSLRSLKKFEAATSDLQQVEQIREMLKEVDQLVDQVEQNPSEPQLEKRFRIGEIYIKYESGRRGEFWLRDVLNRNPAYLPAHALLAEYYEKLAQKRSAYAVLAEKHRRAAQINAPTQ